MTTARIVLVDDHPTFRMGIRSSFAIEPDLEVCAEADNLAEALKVVDRERPDLVVVDVKLGGDSGIDLVQRLSTRDASLKILVLSMYEEELYADRALKAGARGYLSKDAPTATVLEAVRHVLGGGIYLRPEVSEHLVHRMLIGRDGLAEDPVKALSNREMQVYELIGHGRSTKEIADQLHLSVHTIETHRQRIRTKLDLANGTDLVRSATQWMLEHG